MGNISEMLMKSDDLILRAVTRDDLEEISRMWEYPHTITMEQANEALCYMEENHKKNAIGVIYHLCLAVFEKENDKKIIGWCGLDGKIEPGETVLFYVIDENYRYKGYATQCAKLLLKYAFEEMNCERITGGCAKENLGSYRVMEKAGMIQNSFYENGDPAFYMDKQTFLKSADYAVSASQRRTTNAQP